MEAAAILALGLQDWIDAGVIIGILLLNAIVGWYQEKQAADVVASLKGDIAMKARVVRNGQEQEIRARELVPGDIVGCPGFSFALVIADSGIGRYRRRHCCTSGHQTHLRLRARRGGLPEVQGMAPLEHKFGRTKRSLTPGRPNYRHKTSAPRARRNSTRTTRTEHRTLDTPSLPSTNLPSPASLSQWTST